MSRCVSKQKYWTFVLVCVHNVMYLLDNVYVTLSGYGPLGFQVYLEPPVGVDRSVTCELHVVSLAAPLW